MRIDHECMYVPTGAIMLMSLQLQLANSVAHKGVTTHNNDHFKLDEFWM